MCSQFLSALSGISFRLPVQPLVFVTASPKRKHKKLAFIVLANGETAAASMSNGAGAALAGSKSAEAPEIIEVQLDKDTTEGDE